MQNKCNPHEKPTGQVRLRICQGRGSPTYRRRRTEEQALRAKGQIQQNTVPPVN